MLSNFNYDATMYYKIVNVFFRTLDEMIRDNSDYLVNAISLRLRHLERNKKCPLVLRVMLQYSSPELLPLIDETIKDVSGHFDIFMKCWQKTRCCFQRLIIQTCAINKSNVWSDVKGVLYKNVLLSNTPLLWLQQYHLGLFFQ